MEKEEVRGTEYNKGKAIKVIACIILIIVSMTLLTKMASNPENYRKTIEALEQKTSTVTKITALTTGTSAAITAIPGDVGTTVAEHLMDLNSSLLIVLIALFAEKYLLTIIGKAVFFIIIPWGLFVKIIGMLKNNKELAFKGFNIIIAGLLLCAAIPSSVKLSDEIEKVYNINLEETIESGEAAKASTEGATDTGETENEDSDEGNFFSNTISKVTDAVTGAVTGALDKGEEFVETLTESLAVLIVTTCVIPLLTVVFFLWLIKMCIGVDFTGKLIGLHQLISVKQKSVITKKKKKLE